MTSVVFAFVTVGVTACLVSIYISIMIRSYIKWLHNYMCVKEPKNTSNMPIQLNTYNLQVDYSPPMVRDHLHSGSSDSTEWDSDSESEYGAIYANSTRLSGRKITSGGKIISISPHCAPMITQEDECMDVSTDIDAIESDQQIIDTAFDFVDKLTENDVEGYVYENVYGTTKLNEMTQSLHGIPTLHMQNTNYKDVINELHREHNTNEVDNDFSVYDIPSNE
ncbi:hypothetical protein DP163_gp126 [Sea otter poxvirus]|uniref:Uncharacterized protein n=1 Tax=Sea otter poxvirus TaxID=1416741 RepID=A0A2U9QHT3_9POXV|nr:hypothetical protein DP163_gp126 [Sea otter poxvirus]AWU47171.1 hypothetical protein [Sea otter poxvirus]